MSYQIKNGGIVSKEGFPVKQIWCADGRMTFCYDKLGISCIEYFIPTAKNGNRIIFKRGIFDSFRPSLIKDGLCYTPDYKDITIHPYGLETTMDINGESYCLKVYAVKGNIFFVLEGDGKCDFRLTFFEGTQFIPAFNGDLDSRDYDYNRVWKPWKEKDGKLFGGLTETLKDTNVSQYVASSVLGSLETNVTDKGHGLDMAIATNKKANFSVSLRNSRHEIKLKHQGRSVIGLIFAGDKENIEEKSTVAIKNFGRDLKAQLNRYENRYNLLPKIKTPYKEIDDFFHISPLFHESVKADRIGIWRAKTARYWSWGWDSMVSNGTTVSCWQDAESIKDMLDYFEETSDRKKGWAHWFRFDNSVRQYSVVAAQGIYVSLLESYYRFTKDIKTVQKHYEFAKQNIERLLKTESKIKGLFVSSSMVPDYPECVNETGRDISLFNNSVAYSAFRSMEILSLIMKDEKMHLISKRVIADAEKNYFKYFFDEKAGYFAFSLDADTLKQRDVHSICGYFWEGAYNDELVGKNLDKLIDFIMKKGLSELSFINYVLDGTTYDKDANQLHATWGVVEEIVLKTARYNNQDKPIKLWLKKMAYWMNKLTCPEGESYEFVTDDPDYDRWNCDPGTWQTYTVRKWYEEILEVILGITLDEGGITFYKPYCNYTLTNLTLFGKKLNVKVVGKGNSILSITVNGKKLKGTGKIPTDLLNNTNCVVVKLGDKESGLLKAQGVVITCFKKAKSQISFKAQGVGERTFYFNGDSAFVDGKKIEILSGGVISKSCFKLEMQPQKTYDIVIK